MEKASVGTTRDTGYEAPAAAAAGTACLNCGTALTGQFCASCGQRNVPPYPTVRELAVDAFLELSGWDGRFASTFRALVRRPGLLTSDFLEGRRARYISPLRLYLMASLVYFLAAAAAPKVNSGTAVEAAGLRIGVFTPGAAPTKAIDAARNIDPNPGAGPMSAEDRAAVLTSLQKAPAVIRPILRRAIEDPAGFQRAILESMPRMLFALLPIFAGILALFYRGRNYLEHLYFAIHLHAFVFLALTLSEIAKQARLVAVGVVSLFWIPLYAHLALRRVYGGAQGTTLLKELGIGAIYAIVSIPALVGLAMWAARSA